MMFGFKGRKADLIGRNAVTFQKLLQRGKENRPIKVAVVGAGMMGVGVINQMFRMPGVRVCIIADRVIDKARQAFEANGIQPRIFRF